ncbi:hypothetical protein OUZ56_024381 [Daphnia magna]|uniref:Uncharacterized protein n=1 Tax=Daphnia magna TaxID=35525 RepID=A0ABR0B0P4_9CRUS|nr:hypothetical protein OUZ56_024381 [Daphnia magna]
MQPTSSYSVTGHGCLPLGLVYWPPGMLELQSISVAVVRVHLGGGLAGDLRIVLLAANLKFLLASKAALESHMKNEQMDFLLVVHVDPSVYMDRWSGGSFLLSARKVADGTFRRGLRIVAMELWGPCVAYHLV